MKKNDKKIISIFLVLIILISQFSTIIAVENTNEELISLEEYLVYNGVDEDGDEKISDEEWKSVKNLSVDGEWVDISGIEKATNLKILILRSVDLSKINFANYKNLIKLTISNCELKDAELENLSELSILEVYDTDLSEMKISNLESLEELVIENCNLNGFDFSGLKNSKDIIIRFWDQINKDSKVDLDLSMFKKIESLNIRDYTPYSYDYDTDIYTYEGKNNIKTLDISGANNIKELYLESTNSCEIKFPELSNIEILGMDIDKNVNLDLTNSANLERLSISSMSESSKIEETKVNDNMFASSYYVSETNDYRYLSYYKNENIKMSKDGYLDINYRFENADIIIEDTSILELDENKKIWAKKSGETELKIIDALGKEHKTLITIIEKEIDTTLEDSGMTAEIIGDGKILKSNGELWEVNSSTTAEIIDTNVKKYVAERVYNIEDTVFWGKDLINTLYNDNKLHINCYGRTIEIVENVKEIGLKNYISNDGKLYEITTNDITEKVEVNYIMDNAKKILRNEWGQEFIIKEDGTTWIYWFNFGELVSEKIFDFEIKEVNNNMLLKTTEGIVAGGSWTKYEPVEYIIDNNNEPWISVEGNWRKVTQEDVLQRVPDGINLILSEKNNAHLINTGAAMPEEYIEKCQMILTNVNGCSFVEINGNTNTMIDVLTREDGSIWLYDLENGLTKITESIHVEKEEGKTDKEIIISSDINEKKIGDEDCLTGLNLNEKDTLTVNEFINQNNFNKEYKIKICDTEDEELKGDSLIGTGTKVKIYDEDEVIKEYTLVIYGDTDGDAEITAADALNLIKILNNKIKPESQAHVEAGKLSGETELTPADALRIIKHLNKKYEITQDI